MRLNSLTCIEQKIDSWFKFQWMFLRRAAVADDDNACGTMKSHLVGWMLRGVQEWREVKQNSKLTGSWAKEKETKETRLRHPTQWTKESERKTLKEVELSSSLYHLKVKYSIQTSWSRYYPSHRVLQSWLEIKNVHEPTRKEAAKSRNGMWMGIITLLLESRSLINQLNFKKALKIA